MYILGAVHACYILCTGLTYGTSQFYGPCCERVIKRQGLIFEIMFFEVRHLLWGSDSSPFLFFRQVKNNPNFETPTLIGYVSGQVCGINPREWKTPVEWPYLKSSAWAWQHTPPGVHYIRREGHKQYDCRVSWLTLTITNLADNNKNKQQQKGEGRQQEQEG